MCGRLPWAARLPLAGFAVYYLVAAVGCARWAADNGWSPVWSALLGPIFFALVGWIGTVIILGILWFAGGLIDDRRAPRRGKARAHYDNGHWWVQGDGYWWRRNEQTGTWERGDRVGLPAGYGQRAELVWNVQSSEANDTLRWIEEDRRYRVVSTSAHTSGDPIWACNNRTLLHLRRR